MKRVIEPLTTPPASDELKLRLDTVRAMMAAEELDYYVAAHTDNFYYLTNFAYMPFERPFFLIIPSEGKPGLVVPLLEISHAEQRVLIEVDYHTYYEYPAPPGQTFKDLTPKFLHKIIICCHFFKFGLQSKNN